MVNRLRQTVQSIQEGTPAEKLGLKPGVVSDPVGVARVAAEMLPGSGFVTGVQKGGTEGGIDFLAELLGIAGGIGGAVAGPPGIAGGYMLGKGGVKGLRSLLKPEEISEKTLDSFEQISFPSKKTNWWLDELEDKGTVTLYHGTNIKNLDKIKEEGLKVDKQGFTYASPDPDTAGGYSVMARGEKASKGKKGKAYEQAPREERALLEIEVPKEMLERNIPLQRSPASKEKLFSDKGLEKFNKADRMKVFGQENVPMDKGYNTPFYELTEVRFKEPISPEMIKGYSIKPETTKVTKEAATENISVFPKPERMFPEGQRPKGGEYLNPKTGDVSYNNYTANDPKGKPALTDLELAEKIKQKAKAKNFYVTEHIGKKSLNKANLAFPNNIQSANYMSNAQLENARKFLSIAENRNTPAAQNLDKTLEDLKLTIRGSEYGVKPIGNKIDIVFDSKTGVSSIVDDQLINNKNTSSSQINDLLKIDGVKRTSEIDRPKFASEREMFEKAADRFKNQKGSIDRELVEDIIKGAKKATGATLKAAGPLAKGLPFSAGIETFFIPGYQEEGYTPKEIAAQMLTGGMGIPFKDIQEKAGYVRERGLGSALTDAFNKKMALQNIRPSRGLPEDFGKEPELSRDEKLALKLYSDDAQEIINARRKIQADKYKRLEEMTDFDDEMFRDGAMNGGIMRLLKND